MVISVSSYKPLSGIIGRKKQKCQWNFSKKREPLLEALSVTLFPQFIPAFSALPLGLLLRGLQNQARDGKCAAVLVDGHHHHVGTVDHFPNAGRKLFHVRVDAHLH